MLLTSLLGPRIYMWTCVQETLLGKKLGNKSTLLIYALSARISV